MYTKEYLLQTGYFVDNEYFHKYYSLLSENQNQEFIRCKTNAHHVIPRHYFSDRELPLDNSASNKVNLLYKLHMLAHMYLSACTVGRDRHRNLYSIALMSGQKYMQGSDLEYVKQHLDNYQDLYEEAIAAAPNHRKGCHVSEETREKMRKAQKGHASTVRGKTWVNRDGVNKAVNSEELQQYLDSGWLRGRHVVLSEEAKAKMDEARRRPRSDEFCKKMKAIAANQPPRTQESLKKQSETMKLYYSTHKNPFAGKKHRQESIDKNSAAHLGRKAINKDGVVKMVFPQELDTYLENGWNLGKCSR